MIKPMLVAASFAAVAIGAQAQVTGGVAANQNPSSFIALSSADVSGGSLYAAALDFPAFAARPMNTATSIATVGDWLAAGPSNTNNGGNPAATFTLPGSGSSFVSFLWGSPDVYNSLTVNTSGGAKSFVTADFGGLVMNGDQQYASYVGFTADPGLLITSLVFSSTANAFEASNFSLTAPVPEPASYALMLAGIAAIGFIARRRKA